MMVTAIATLSRLFADIACGCLDGVSLGKKTSLSASRGNQSWNFRACGNPKRTRQSQTDGKDGKRPEIANSCDNHAQVRAIVQATILTLRQI
jgi:hypothetical protein